MKLLKSYFELALESNASDLHLVGDEKPTIRVEGVLQNVEETDISSSDLETGVFGMLSSEQKKTFLDELELDFSYEIGEVRFRVNIHRQNNKIGLSARLIPKNIPTPEELRFEPVLENCINLLDGLVLVVGPTGHGKSTTIASMVEKINQTRKSHIITIEDPVEFTFEDKESLIEQREVGVDTKSFDAALKHVLRQDPNVIVVGEMRDPETIATVLTAAEAVERIVDVFEGAKQKQVLIQLSAVLRCIVAQQLVPTVDNKRVAAREILVNTPAISNLIRENNIVQIQSSIQTGVKDGMVTMDNAITKLLKDGLISKETADNRIGRHRKI